MKSRRRKSADLSSPAYKPHVLAERNPHDGSRGIFQIQPTSHGSRKIAGPPMFLLPRVKPEDIFVDKGYKGSDHHLEGANVYISGRRLKGAPRKLLKRRSVIEPVIGHLKLDRRTGRNYLMRTEGDRINAMLVGCGFNLRKLLRVFFCLIFEGLEMRDWRDFQCTPALSTLPQPA